MGRAKGLRVLFLDIDGVLNRHEKHPGSVYCGIRADCMAELNRVIHETGCSLVISSAWRYQILLGAMTHRGFENMLCTHGLVCREGTVVGATRKDVSPECADRGQQIREWLMGHSAVKCWAVVDDCPKGMPMCFGKANQWRLVKTCGDIGLIDAGADCLIEILGR